MVNDTIGSINAGADLQDRIRGLLREGRTAAIERERTEFDRLAGPFAESLVLFGCGAIGRKTANGLRSVGIEPLAFADNDPSLWGGTVEGIAVMSPKEAFARFGQSSTFVVTIWRGEGPERTRDRMAFLRGLGCEHISTFGPLWWKYPRVFLPHYSAAPAHWVHDAASEVLEAALLWEDAASRREYLSQVRWRLFFDFDGLADPVGHVPYFPPDLCSLTGNEVFVDCGAYDGDTLTSLFKQPQPSSLSVIAFEPDPASFARLNLHVSHLAQKDSIVLHQAATGASNGRVRFSADGSPASAVGSGTLEVECVRLDDALAGYAPSYLKMDIEGAEPDALEGARRIIQQHAPVLAICVYHQQDHLWKVARLIHSIRPDYHFFLRPHMADVWDLVCYAIPPSRLRSQVRPQGETV